MTYRGVGFSVMPTAGINNGADPTRIRADQSPDCRNVRFRDNRISKREGYAKYISGQDAGSSPVTGMAELLLDSGTTRRVVVAGAAVYEDAGASWSAITGAITITNDKDNRLQWAQLNSLLIGCNGTNALFKVGSAGNAAVLSANPSFTPHALTMYKNYLIVGRGGDVEWSGLNNPESWTASDANEFFNAAGQKIMAFAQLNDQLYVMMNRSIQQMAYTADADTPFAFPTRVPNLGTVSGQSVVTFDDWIYFASPSGFWAFNGSSFVYISEAIEGTWATLNASRLKFIVGRANPRHREIWWAACTGSVTENDIVMVFNVDTKEWTLFDGIAANSFGLFEETAPLDIVFGDYDGAIFKANNATYADNGAAIDAYCLCKPYDLGDPSRTRIVDEVRAIWQSEDEDGAAHHLGGTYDLETPTTGTAVGAQGAGSQWDEFVWDSGTWAAGGLDADVSMIPDGHGRWFWAYVGNQQLNVGMDITEISLHFTPNAGEGGGR